VGAKYGLKPRTAKENMANRTDTPNKSHIPVNSTLFEKIIPGLLILMAVLTVVLILFAVGVLLGFIHF
jgi:hypothetical protein